MAWHTPVAQLTPPTKVGDMQDMTVLQSKPCRDSEGSYPGFVALVRRDEAPFSGQEFATILVYFNDDSGRWSACWGHYDLSFDDAEADFVVRST